ncbi:MAG: hypothetical protein HPY59_09835 [Anaerolineae bacterium]|nr:hypothetical protein [Anaerolineae bacterium]
MTAPNVTPPSRFSRLAKNFLRGLLRLLLVLLLGALTGGILYFGGVFLYTQFHDSQSQISERLSILETGQASSSNRFEETAASLQERIAALEQQQTLDRENFSSLKTNLQSLQEAVETQNQSLKKLDELDAEIAKMTDWLSYEATQVVAIQMTQTAPDSPFRSLRSEIKILRAMELLNRARLFLLQSNYGLATEDIQAARRELQSLQAEVPAYQQETVLLWIERLGSSLAALPASPVQASSDLDLAWKLLAAGLPTASPPLPETTATIQPPAGATPSPTGLVEKTPTPIRN